MARNPALMGDEVKLYLNSGVSLYNHRWSYPHKGEPMRKALALFITSTVLLLRATTKSIFHRRTQ